MAIQVVMPQVGESVSSGVIAVWLKKPGDAVKKDENIVAIETDKATVDVPSPASGILGAHLFAAGTEVKVGVVLTEILEGGQTTAPSAPAAAAPKTETSAHKEASSLSPAVARIVGEKGLDAATIEGTGPAGRLLKSDVQDLPVVKAPTLPATLTPAPAAQAPIAAAPKPIAQGTGARTETTVAMTPIRKRIAERLLQAQSTAAMLTTFNEIDMGRVMELRAQFQDQFTKKHGVKLGFMSFFVKAVLEGLKTYPIVNAEVRGTDIVYKNYFDIGIAVGGGKGLVVPIIRNAEALSFADIEKTISDLGTRAKDNKIKLEELAGGTFSITNGGIYGSMMSTPILNPPQSAILGMHNIVKRAVVVNDQIVIRPMMYLALSYDHRIVDGREAVSFLVRVKECIESPERLLLEA